MKVMFYITKICIPCASVKTCQCLQIMNNCAVPLRESLVMCFMAEIHHTTPLSFPTNIQSPPHLIPLHFLPTLFSPLCCLCSPALLFLLLHHLLIFFHFLLVTCVNSWGPHLPAQTSLPLTYSSTTPLIFFPNFGSFALLCFCLFYSYHQLISLPHSREYVLAMTASLAPVLITGFLLALSYATT